MYGRPVHSPSLSAPSVTIRTLAYGCLAGGPRCAHTVLKPNGLTDWPHLETSQLTAQPIGLTRGLALRSLGHWPGSRQRYAVYQSQIDHPDKLHIML